MSDTVLSYVTDRICTANSHFAAVVSLFLKLVDFFAGLHVLQHPRLL